MQATFDVYRGLTFVEKQAPSVILLEGEDIIYELYCLTSLRVPVEHVLHNPQNRVDLDYDVDSSSGIEFRFKKKGLHHKLDDYDCWITAAPTLSKFCSRFYKIISISHCDSLHLLIATFDYL